MSSPPLQVESETQSRAAADRLTAVKDLAHAAFASRHFRRKKVALPTAWTESGAPVAITSHDMKREPKNIGFKTVAHDVTGR